MYNYFSNIIRYPTKKIDAYIAHTLIVIRLKVNCIPTSVLENTRQCNIKYLFIALYDKYQWCDLVNLRRCEFMISNINLEEKFLKKAFTHFALMI